MTASDDRMMYENDCNIFLCSTKEGFLKQFERCFYDREERELIFEDQNHHSILHVFQ